VEKEEKIAENIFWKRYWKQKSMQFVISSYSNLLTVFWQKKPLSAFLMK